MSLLQEVVSNVFVTGGKVPMCLSQEVKFRPLGGFALLQAQGEGRKKQRLRTMVRQTIAYLLLTATLLAVANIYFGPSWLRSASHVENSIVYTDTASTGAVDFYNISR